MPTICTFSIYTFCIHIFYIHTFCIHTFYIHMFYITRPVSTRSASTPSPSAKRQALPIKTPARAEQAKQGLSSLETSSLLEFANCLQGGLPSHYPLHSPVLEATARSIAAYRRPFTSSEPSTSQMPPAAAAAADTTRRGHTVCGTQKSMRTSNCKE